MNNLKDILNDTSAVIVDVRSPWEFESAHVKGAKNIPLEEISAHSQELKQLGRPLVLYCRSGNRSAVATTILKQLGLTGVYNGGSISDLQALLN